MKERKKFEVINRLSEIIFKLNPFSDVFLTIVNLKLPKKGGIMKVYLSVFPEEKIDEVIGYFNKISSEVKKEIKQNIFLRYLPSKIVFLPSYELKEAHEVLMLLEKIKYEEENKKKENQS